MPYSINREDLAWAAGFVDGEGCFTVKNESKATKGGSIYRYPKLCVAQSGSNVLLLKLQTLFRCGVVYGPYTKNHSTAKKPRWIYEISGFEKVQFAAALVWSWLGQEKKNRANALLSGYLVHLNRKDG